MDPGAHGDPETSDGACDRLGTADAAGGSVEGRQKPITGGVDLAAAEPRQLGENAASLSSHARIQRPSHIRRSGATCENGAWHSGSLLVEAKAVGDRGCLATAGDAKLGQDP
jgi:hypothetical protein